MIYPPPDENPDSFAESNPYLTVDTSLFPASFQTALLAALSNDHDLDEATDGLLIHSDNFQALNLLQARYRGQVKCIYIDPPYNTGDDGFPYKDNYQSSSWLSMFECRLNTAKPFLNQNGLFACHMDEHEHFSLEWLSKQIFQDGDLGKLVWDKRNPKGLVKGLASQHEYIHFATNNLSHLSQENSFVRNKENAESMLKKVEQLIKKYGISEQTRKEYKEWLKQNKDNLTGGEKAYKDIDNKGNIFRLVSMAAPDKPETRSHRPLIHPITGKPCPVPAKGWRFTDNAMDKLIAQNRIIFGKDETTQPQNKYLLKENLTDIVSSLYYMGGSDEGFFKNANLPDFPNPKPVQTAKYCLLAMARSQNSLILDYFAGSGTTAHAVINLNREDGGKRKYILVEQGEYFDTVLKPRVQKVVYAENWKDGKPQADKESSLHGVPQIVKVLKLESYEDTLNNLVLKDNGDLFAKLNDGAKEDYLLRYMLDDQSRDSLLNTDVFRRPFNYQMDIATNSAGATERMDIDLVETFNYLLGLRVHAVKDRIEKDGYLAVEGTLPDGETALVFWRDYEKVGYEGLDALLGRLKINPQDSEYDTVYINGDHNIATVWENENGVTGRLKIRQIESEFMALMFGEAQ